MHVNDFSVNCSVSLELWYLLKNHCAGNEELSPCAWAQVALTFEGQAFYSILELALTWFPLGDFICFQSRWLSQCCCGKVSSSLRRVPFVNECEHSFQSVIPTRISSEPGTATACGLPPAISPYPIRVARDRPWWLVGQPLLDATRAAVRHRTLAPCWCNCQCCPI